MAAPRTAAHWALILLVLPANVAMVQTQDVLGLGSEGRMNMPGTAAGAWKWRLRDGALTRPGEPPPGGYGGGGPAPG